MLLNTIKPGAQDELEVWNSPLQEAAALGFEYGCARPLAGTPRPSCRLCTAAPSSRAPLATRKDANGASPNQTPNTINTTIYTTINTTTNNTTTTTT